MKKIVRYFLIAYLLMFSSLINVHAECSYKERKKLLEEAKNVEAFFEAKVDLNKFVFYLFNLTNNIYATLELEENTAGMTIYKEDMVDDSYSFDVVDTENVINYKLTLYSKNTMCYGDKLISKTIKKGIINKYAKESVCKGAEDYQYCKTVLDKKITLSEAEVYDKIFRYKQEKEPKPVEKEEFDIKNFFKKSWYYFAGAGIFVVIILIFVKINKKRGEL